MPPNLQAILPLRVSPVDLDLPPGPIYRLLVGSAIVLGLAAFLFAMLYGDLYRPVRQVIEAGNISVWVLKPSLILASMGLLLLALRTVLWFGYRPFESATYESAPTMTVVIPAYNEGALVEQSIESVAAARYPQGRLEILVVDDGSTDDTWTHIRRAAARHADLVTAVQFERNQGKRAALAAGFRAARGAVLVTIDSDSVIEPNALLAMAGPFRDPRVGAVAGTVAILNRDQGIIPQMLHVRFVLAFDFQRSAQSIYRTVYCYPGALAGYRASVIREILEPWLAQHFLGKRCTIGEDRALTNTNAILERGYDTVYQGSAVVRTLVPNTYAKLCRMYLRWERRNVREEIQFARIVWKRPLVPMVIAVFEKLVTNLRFPISWISTVTLMLITLSDPTVLVRVLIAIGVGSGFFMLYYVYTERSMRFVHGILYSYFSFFALWSVVPYATLTVRSRSWMTR